jgi:hypothetical protein
MGVVLAVCTPARLEGHSWVLGRLTLVRSTRLATGNPRGGRALFGDREEGLEGSEGLSLTGRTLREGRTSASLSPPPLGAAAPPPPLPRFPSPEWEWSGAPRSAREPLPSAPGARTRRGRRKGGRGMGAECSPWCVPQTPRLLLLSVAGR